MTTATPARPPDAADAPAKLTYEDYAKTPEWERWELIDGVLIMAAAPNMIHQNVQRNLAYPVETWVRLNELGKVFTPVTDVVLSDTTTLQPDLIFVSNARLHIETDANIQGAPDLVVEILSPSTTSRDWRDKMDLYEIHGVPEYWIVDPVNEMLWQFRLRGGKYALRATFGEDDTLTTPALEGFSLPMSDVFPRQP